MFLSHVLLLMRKTTSNVSELKNKNDKILILPISILTLLCAGLFYLHGSAASNGLVASYNFDEGSGTFLTDRSGTGNNGTLTNGPTWNASGKYGKALSFDGTNDYVNIPDSNSLDLTTGMTLEAWIKPTVSTGYRDIVFKTQPSHEAYAMYVTNGSSRPTGHVNIGGEKTAQGTAQVSTTTWTHLATTYDGTALKLFVNGVQVSSTAVTGNIPVTNLPLTLGGDTVWPEWFKGLMDDVRIYNRPLSATEIQSDMNTPVTTAVNDSTPPTTPADLVKTSQTENSISISWSTSSDNVSVSGYGIYKNSVLVNTSSTTSFTLTGLSCGTTYDIGVDAVDSSNNRSSPAPLTASTDLCDTSPPTVQITSPAGGTTVAGAVSVSADATDNKAITGVQFKLDGANLGVEDTNTPYTVSWDTTAGANGNHVLTAIARDGSGNTTTSTTVTVNVFNQAPNFVNDKLIIGLSEPTKMVFTPDGRMLICERGGEIWVVQPGSQSVDPTPFLHLTNVFVDQERGLLGIALDPNFSSNGYFYLYYTNVSTQKNQVSRFTASGNSASLASEQMIWQNDTVSDIWHQGGDLQFGPDGKLYVAVGDHLQPNTAQSLTSYNGKILRMNTDGSAPTDNPYYDGAGPNKDAIWMLGLRNPFRFSFDSVNGRMYVGDVGQDTWEEVELGAKGANYGWPTCEGNCSVAGMTNPIYAYNHSGHDACVVGGFVYRGTQFPADYQGTYIFGDYSQNWVKRLTLDSNGNSSGVVNFIPADGSLDGPYGDIVDFAMGPDGSLYYVDNGPFATNNAGSIHRVKNVNANQPPTAQASADVASGPAPLTANFSSIGSSDPEGQPITYSWDFGDGSTSTQANPSHTYNNRGRYTVRLTTSDGTNNTPSNVLTITVGSPPQVTINNPTDGAKFRAGDTITLSGAAMDAEDGPLGGSNLSWKVVFHHETHIHPYIDQIVGSNGSFQIPTSGHSFHESTSYEIVLTATDSDGIQTQKSVSIYPDKVNLNFTSQPAGLTVNIDGVPQTTPFVYDTLIGFQHTIDVPSPQFVAGNRYDFASWSDGGAISHMITIPTADQLYAANFSLTSTAPPGLVAAYTFDEGNGGTLYDVSGNNNNGTLSGPVWVGGGKYGGALSFNGTSDIVNVTDSASLDFTNGLTLEAWVNPTQIGTAWRSVIFKERPGGMLYSLYAGNGSNRPLGQAFLQGAEQNAAGTSAVSLNTWTHLTSTYDGANLKLYVNGTLVSTKAVTGTLANTADPLRIGGNSIWGEFFQGQIDNVRLYNRALMASEIQTDMNTPLNLSF
jgi:glucose/arabinose dehydrogenase